MAASGIDELFDEWYSQFNSGTYVFNDERDKGDSDNILIEPDKPTTSNNTDLSRNEQLTTAQLQSVQIAQQTTHE